MNDLREQVSIDGLVVLPQIDEAKFLRTARSLGTPHPHPDAEKSGRTVIRPDGRAGVPGLGFTFSSLTPHTDRSRHARPPRFLGIHLVHQDATTGGFPRFVDLNLVTANLEEKDLDRLRLKERDGPGMLPVRLGRDAGFRYRDDDVWALDGPGPLVGEFRRRMDQATQTVDWLHSGDAYVVDNHRYAHGRTSIASPQRTAVRILIDATDTATSDASPASTDSDTGVSS
ncbi:TauD/TfdA family dioxygenase [Myceligenerans pegani]|uniref:TauD/TfdA family dioxygenase n=1 Tax=Myceligenerans pegani TaxID=2776917 RepID=A0ABR9N1C1_9MICO|nr:TauD/TfdA family dioxygenase [Myceligenerans sp. TRM 65318]MBE1877457.1 TauD/TfdA family dioxygenase [Myceligenerans sp. TRM 65318]MBE3019728.1 TauD/TfdA family dioxygenase [Myceligenerans sp. TRM 65318]